MPTCRIIVLCLGILLPAGSGGIAGENWPQWGGSDGRNMVSDETGLPDSFVPGKKSPSGEGIDPATTENVKWSARLGSCAYGNPTVADGRVFVGTDDVTIGEDGRFERTKGGLVKCLDEQTGELLWQLVIPQRTITAKDSLYGHQFLGVCSSPTVEEDRVYVVSSADELLCLDADGMADGNDGPFQEEAQYMVGPGKPPVKLTDRDADIIWRYDMIGELGVVPHDAASCSALVHGPVVYTGTSNGVDKPHEKVVNPQAPSLIAVDKLTGRLVATDGEKIGERLYHCQWSPPSLGEVNGKTLIFFGGGDGVCYAFEAVDKVADKPQTLKKVWSYDCIPPEYKYRDGKPIPYYNGDKRKKLGNTGDGTYVGPSQIIATPVFYNGRVYIAIGQDPAHGRGRGMLHCIDAAKTGDVTQSGRVWAFDGIDRSLSTVAVADGVLYAADVAGKLYTLDPDSGKLFWKYESGAETWGGPLLADGKVYWGNQRDFYVFTAGREPKLLNKLYLGSPVYTTSIAAGGVLYVTSQRYLWALQKDLPAVAQAGGQ
jgi:outer membrane protein assembly factor BamB